MVQTRALITIVDDDPAVCNALKFRLELEGFTVHTYSNGQDLLKTDDLPSNDCLILDYKMPEMNGMELLAELRRRQICTPAILMTTNPTRLLREQAQAAHVDVIEKPLLNDALLQSIMDALQ